MPAITNRSPFSWRERRSERGSAGAGVGYVRHVQRQRGVPRGYYGVCTGCIHVFTPSFTAFTGCKRPEPTFYRTPLFYRSPFYVCLPLFLRLFYIAFTSFAPLLFLLPHALLLFYAFTPFTACFTLLRFYRMFLVITACSWLLPRPWLLPHVPGYRMLPRVPGYRMLPHAPGLPHVSLFTAVFKGLPHVLLLPHAVIIPARGSIPARGKHKIIYLISRARLYGGP